MCVLNISLRLRFVASWAISPRVTQFFSL
jgi:hypothetical protein